MGHHRQISVAAALAALVSASAPAAAQELLEPRPRQGYYVALGAHGVLQHNREEGDGLGLFTGMTTTLRLGQMLTRRLGLGVQLDVGGTSREGRSSSLVGVGLAGQLELARNLAVHAVAGLGVVSLAGEEEGDELTGTYGAAYTLGVTYDWFPWGGRRSGGWGITPGAQLRAVTGDPVTSFAAFFGVEVSYWTGLSKNQLELPPEDAFE